MDVDDVESSLGTALADLIPDHRPQPGLAARVVGTVRRRRRRWAALGAGLAVVLITVGGISLLGPSSWPDDSGASSLASLRGPDPVNSNKPHLILTPSVLPAAGGDVALIAANPSGEAFEYGVDGTVARWNGVRWQSYRSFTSDPDSWGGAGQLYGVHANFVVFQVGLRGPAHGYGSIEWVHVSGLPAGYYRITQADASGILRIASDPPTPAPIRSTATNVLLGIGVVPAEEASEITPVPTIINNQGTDHTRQRLGALTGPVRIERLTGRAWSAVTLPTADLTAVPITGSPLQFAAHLPPLPAGVYRITRTTTKAGDIAGLFWALPRL